MTFISFFCYFFTVFNCFHAMASTFGEDHSLGANPPGGHPPGGHPPAQFYESSRQAQVVMIVLTGVNIFAAIAMVGRILWDTRAACMRRRRDLRKDDIEEKGGGRKESDDGGGGGGRGELGQRIGLEVEQMVVTSESSKRLLGGGELDTRAWWEMIPAIELFPLILAVTIFVQGIMLAVVEGEALNNNFFDRNCRFSSEVTWVGEFSRSMIGWN